jgi:cysteine desulfurase
MTIYFDHNATTPINREVLEEMLPFLETNYANPSSLYSQGRIARNAINIAREQVSELVNAHPSQVIFTSGGTEANNLAIKGALQGMSLGGIAYSAIEHPSVIDVVKHFDGIVRNSEIPANANGVIDEDALVYICEQESSLLVSSMLANNETGTIQDIEVFAQIARSHDHFVHTDAVQAIGKMPVDFFKLGVHLMSVSGHKIYGPKGIGALIYDKSINIEPILHGGGQEKNLRSGTENVAAIVGFGKAAEIAKNKLGENQEYLKKLQQYFESRLKQFSNIVLFGSEAKRLANTVFFSVPGIDGETLLMQLDEYGIAVTSGSACASKSELPSHVLMAMGVEEQIARSSIRVSFGLQNTTAEIDDFFAVLAAQMSALGLFNIKV